MAGELGWDGALAAIRRAAAAAVNAQADLAKERTQKFTPDDPKTGGDDLRESYFVEHADPSEAQPSAQLGTDNEYAVYQHETLYLEHPHGGQPKYMESAVVAGNSRALLTDAAIDAFRQAL